jgi:uncharacterized protein with NRDE domain
MCLILFAYDLHPRHRLILAANRDEFYDRLTAPLQFWPDHPDVIAGRDLKQMGTWLGITRQGRLAAVTNFREPGVYQADARSRGHLVADFLSTDMPAPRYLEELRKTGHRYNGFNLLVGDRHDLYYFSNRSGAPPLTLKSGIYGLSNRLLDTDWPKVHQGKARLAALVKADGVEVSLQNLLDLLKSQKTAEDDQLPHTGVGLEWERVLAPVFITSPTYGTRSSSLLTIGTSGKVEFNEFTWYPGRATPVVQDHQQFSFCIRPPDAL